MAAYKWWRVSNITVRDTSNPARSLAEIRFVNTEGVQSNISSKGFSESAFGESYLASNGFDGDPNTLTHNISGADIDRAKLYYIGYQFENPVSVTEISLQMRQDMQPSWGQEWQSADVECSNDGVSWFKYGVIYPKIAQMNLQLVTISVLSANTLSVSSLPYTSIFLNTYSLDESGSLSGLVTQGETGESKLPLKAEVLLYDRMTNKLMQRTWSSDLGAYSFTGLDTGREYYAVSIHPDRTYNAVIQDGLKSGMTT